MPLIVTGPLGSRVVPAGVDTESAISSVDVNILRALGCAQVGSMAIDTVIGVQMVPTFAAGLATAGGIDLGAGIPSVLGDSLPGPDVRALIGRDILARFSLAYDEPDGTWELDAGGAGPSVPGAFSAWWIALGAGVAGSLAAFGILALGGTARREILAQRRGR